MKRSRLFPCWSQVSAAVVFALLLATSFAAAQTYFILHSYSGNLTDGAQPDAGLVADKSGRLYGTTTRGGTVGSGTVFQLTPPATAGGAWTQTILHNFTGGIGGTGNDGAYPAASLVYDRSGNLFGTTTAGGLHGDSNGTVFQLSPPATSGGAWTYTVIASFGSNQDAVAISPFQLVFDRTGSNLYGISAGGFDNVAYCGESPCGNVFELRRPSVSGGSWTGTSIYNFFTSGTTDGIGPSGIIFGPDGLYGATRGGGTNSSGIFFKLVPPTVPRGAWTEEILYNFAASGGNPSGELTLGGNGSFFGTTSGSGTFLGAVFQLIPPSGGGGWSESVIYTFSHGSDGAYPFGVVSDKAGNLYGVALGGALQRPGCLVENGCGAVFELSPPAISGGAWTETTLHDFTSGYDGSLPIGHLLLRNGALFGVTVYGGLSGQGTVFRIKP